MDKIISWNVRGINSQQKQNMVKHFIAIQKVGLVGLLETRVKAPKLGALYMNMFSGWCFTTNLAWHKGGRIILAWNPNQFIVCILTCSSQLIHIRVTTFDGKYQFYATFVYGFNDEQGRQQLWQGLQGLSSTDPWIVLGDFNDILHKEERIGDRVRILANEAWMELLATAEAIFLTEGLFDHTPVVVSIHPAMESGRKPFKYFRMWSSHPNFQQIILAVWNQHVQGIKMYQVVTKLKALKSSFKELNKCHFSDIQAADVKSRPDLFDCQTRLQKDPLSKGLQEQEADSRKIYADVHKNYCSFLHQNSRMAWIKDGMKILVTP
ncbi:hypothetical protein CsatB_007857 [Cannabis sativa]|uniref:uncharacterized protein LOC115725531 n=1 Tax=Cannabis sativa TaxID=3483 RepID=UPI0011E044BC|nr:uncharacterized protein LOC115725531 [Cannabis sativa]